jgi:hypothetical protein
MGSGAIAEVELIPQIVPAITSKRFAHVLTICTVILITVQRGNSINFRLIENFVAEYMGP